MQGWWIASYIVLWMLVVALSLVVVALARQIGTLHLRLGPRGALEIDTEGPPLGHAPQSLAATDLEGREVVIGGPGEPQLLLFVSPGCMVCEQVLPSLGAVAARAGMTPLVLTDLEPEEAARAFAATRPPEPLVPAPEATVAYAVPGTPFVVALDELGVVRAKGTPNNLEQMEGLVDSARRRIEQATHERQAN